jgi:hypothetical protein
MAFLGKRFCVDPPHNMLRSLPGHHSSLQIQAEQKRRQVEKGQNIFLYNDDFWNRRIKAEGIFELYIYPQDCNRLYLVGWLPDGSSNGVGPLLWPGKNHQTSQRESFSRSFTNFALKMFPRFWIQSWEASSPSVQCVGAAVWRCRILSTWTLSTRLAST